MNAQYVVILTVYLCQGFFFLINYRDTPQNHWFTYNETLTVESVTQAVSNLALQFGEEDADPGAMVSPFYFIRNKLKLIKRLLLIM